MGPGHQRRLREGLVNEREPVQDRGNKEDNDVLTQKSKDAVVVKELPVQRNRFQLYQRRLAAGLDLE
jgi:hypothetical protein